MPPYYLEQMLELQQQLCDAESAAESLRDANSDLRGSNRDLTSKLEILESDSSRETYEAMWRQSQVPPILSPFSRPASMTEEVGVAARTLLCAQPALYPDSCALDDSTLFRKLRHMWRSSCKLIVLGKARGRHGNAFRGCRCSVK